jgi:hypothetical protein
MRPEDRGPAIVRPPGANCPIPVNRDVNISEIAESCLEVVARDKYTGDDPRFQNKTRLEAAVLSLAEDATEDPQARTEFLDRIMGKPRQRNENTNVNISLTGFLEQLAREDQQVIDVTPTPDDDSEEDLLS